MPASPFELGALAALVLVAAVLYSSGGHGGASAYLAMMALFGVTPAAMKPTALLLNVVVAGVGAVRFTRAGAVPWPSLRWLLLGSMPAAYLGGGFTLSSQAYRPVLGALLVFAAARLFWPGRADDRRRPAPHAAWLVAVGAAMGFVSGVTGIGGGIFLSPLLLLTGWEDARRTAGAAAVFILLNSVLGFAGHLSAAQHVPASAGLLAVVALAGGLMGSWLGAVKLNVVALRRVTALVLVVSGAKLLMTVVQS